MTLEEFFRSHFRARYGVNGTLRSGKPIDNAGFADLLEEAEHINLIEKREIQELHSIRREIRNHYVHPKDVTGDAKNKRPDFSEQYLKTQSSSLVPISVIDEAKVAMKILLELVPKISKRLWKI
ncbi:MAG: hypothetical protein WDO71_08280 [Bacteroidota bacterium]